MTASRLGALQLAVITLVAGAAGLAAVASPAVAYALGAILVLGLYALYANRHPRGAAIVMFASLSLVPVYTVPTVAGAALEPTAILAVVLAAVLVRNGVRFRLTVLDVAVGALVGGMLVAALLGPAKILGTVVDLSYWIPAYFAGRIIAVRPNGPRTLVLGAAVAGLISLPFILYEAVSGTNVFFKLANAHSYLSAIYAVPAFRGGSLLRVQAAFGHPLSMASVVASASVFAGALALRSKTSGNRIMWVAAAGALVIAQNTAHERSGWVVFAGGALLLAVTAIPRTARFRYGFPCAMIALPLVLLAVAFLGNSDASPTNTAVASAETDSSDYRTALYKHALQPGALTVLGEGQAQLSLFAYAVDPAHTAVDSAYLKVGDQYGLISLLPLLAVAAAVVGVLVRVRGTWVAAIPAVTVANLIALTVVSFQTQQQIFIWLLIGAVAGVSASHSQRSHV